MLMAVMNLLIMTVPLFYGNCGAAFNQDLSSWDISKVTINDFINLWSQVITPTA